MRKILVAGLAISFVAFQAACAYAVPVPAQNGLSKVQSSASIKAKADGRGQISAGGNSDFQVRVGVEAAVGTEAQGTGGTLQSPAGNSDRQGKSHEEGSHTVAVDKAVNSDETKGSEDVQLRAEAGITPDQFLYIFDKLGEQIQLMFAFSDKKRAELLLQNADERKAEAALMVKERQGRYVKPLIAQYMMNLNAAQDVVLNAVAGGSLEGKSRMAIKAGILAASRLQPEVEDGLKSALAAKLEQDKKQARLTAGVLMKLNGKQVAALRSEGYDLSQIVRMEAKAETGNQLNAGSGNTGLVGTAHLAFGS